MRRIPPGHWNIPIVSIVVVVNALESYKLLEQADGVLPYNLFLSQIVDVVFVVETPVQVSVGHDLAIGAKTVVEHGEELNAHEEGEEDQEHETDGFQLEIRRLY